MRNSIRAALFLMIGAMLAACSGGSEDEPGVIETKTKEIGQEAVRMIKTPIDKAQAVADKEAERARQMNQPGAE